MNDLGIRVRSQLRRFGLTRYLRPHRIVLQAYYRRRYRLDSPSEVAIGFEPLLGRLTVRSAAEYAILKSKREDASFLRLLADELGEGDCFWDVGSNVGFYAVLASKAVGASGTVVAFEPEPGSRQRLRENVALNGLSNVRVLDCALGRASGELTLEASSDPLAGTHRLTMDRKDAIEGAHRVRVQVARGDDLPADVPRPNGVKIDVEGFELDVIEGTSRTLGATGCRALLCEVHFGLLEQRGIPFAPRTIEARVRDLGFRRVRWVDPSHLFALK